MKDQEILKKAILKAIDGGYNWESNHSNMQGWINYACQVRDYPTLIFSHDFAKAFWGFPHEDDGLCGGQDMWQFHLQQMVLEKNPLNYLEKFI